jgi:cell division protein FtsI (penicillin-binding protein 3)
MNSKLKISNDIEKELFSSMYLNNSTKNSDYVIETYIDSIIQKVAISNLITSMKEHNSTMGYVIVMETTTGKIKSLSSLEKSENNKFTNSSKFYINDAIEPGGLIKTFNLMALLEDKKADTASIINSNNGEVSFYGRLIKDSNHETKRLTLSEAFANSSNTIFAQLINNSYQNEPRKFVDNFEKFGLNYSFKLPFTEGNFKAYVPKPNSNEWSKITLPWMSIGYGIRFTPVQLLSYYNTIANNGIMVQPLFLSKITSKNGLEKNYNKQVLKQLQISKNTISTLQKLLQRTVTDGIAKNAYSNKVSISGYAANTQINYADKNNKSKYSSSFIGYFPSESPKYTIMVYLNGQYSFQKNVAGFLVNEIASKIK